MNNLPNQKTDKRLMLLDENDNIFMVIQQLNQLENIWVNNMQICLEKNVKLGFKLARYPIDEGVEILKYGYVIGIATKPIKQGELIHFHNIASTYLPSVLKPEQLEDKQ